MIKLIVAGDLCPILRAEEYALHGQFDKIYNDLLPLLRDSDLAIVNLECPLTTSNDKILKIGPHLKANPKTIELVKHGGFNVIALANNHILDYGEKGLFDTIDLVCEKGMMHVGAGKNLETARQPLLLTVKKETVAVINATEREFSTATENRPGANPLDAISLYHQIIGARKQAHYIIVYLHGGNEHYELPNPELVRICRFIADLGVSAIFVNHSHTPSGYEIYKGVPIFYGLGNFIFDWSTKQNDNWYKGFLVELDLDNDVTDFRIHPYWQFRNNEGIELCDELERSAFIKEIEQLNDIIKQETVLDDHWMKYLDNNRNIMYSALFSFNPALKKIAKTFPHHTRKIFINRLLSFLNIVRCESHRSLLIGSLERYLQNKS